MGCLFPDGLYTTEVSFRCPLVISAIFHCTEYDQAHKRITPILLYFSTSKLSLKGFILAITPNSPLSNQVASKRAWSLLLEDAMEVTDHLVINKTIYVTTGRLSKFALWASIKIGFWVFRISYNYLLF